MTPRSFALGCIAFAMLLMAGTIVANVAIDPEAVFNPELAGQRVNSNSRYVYYVAYRKSGGKADAALFASSRGNAFELGGLAQRLGVNAVTNFSFTYGMVTDHLPMIRYLIRDKASRGERLKSVMLMLDVDVFGKIPWTNTNLDGFLPPEVSGEHPARFWWRYLTAFQFRVWIATLRREPGRRADAPALPRPLQAGVIPVPALRLSPSFAFVAGGDVPPDRRYETVQRPQLEVHLGLLAEIVALCRAHGVALTVMTSPLNRNNVRNLDPAELARVTARIAHVTPLWDFGTPDWLSDRPDLWTDPSHFKPEVARMMLDRIFGPAPSGPADFGTLRGG